MVLILDQKTPQGLWPMGKVLETRIGSDGIARKFRIQLGSTCTLVRSAASLSKCSLNVVLRSGRLLHGTDHKPPVLWPGGIGSEARARPVLEAKREKALKVLETRRQYEDARRMFILQYGPGRKGLFRRALRKEKGHKGNRGTLRRASSADL